MNGWSGALCSCAEGVKRPPHRQSVSRDHSLCHRSGLQACCAFPPLPPDIPPSRPRSDRLATCQSLRPVRFSRDSVSGLNLTCINPRDRSEELYARFRARLNEPFSLSIFFWSCKIEYSSASGRGGHPGTYTSTGIT